MGRDRIAAGHIHAGQRQIELRPAALVAHHAHGLRAQIAAVLFIAAMAVKKFFKEV